jgi:ribosomal subunit interface protein
MTTSIKASHIELTPAIRSYIEEKLSKIRTLIARHDNAFIEAEVGKATGSHHHGNLFHSEIAVVIPGRGQLRSVADREDLYAAIDEAQNEMIREIRTMRGKRESAFLRGARRIKSLVRS